MELKKMIFDCLTDNLELIRKEREDNLANWRTWNSRPNKAVVVFGASAMCEICIRYLERLGIDVDIICDNNSSRFGEFVTDNGKTIKIVSVDEALSDAKEKLCFVAAGAQHFDNISGQLENYSIQETVLKWHLDFYLETVMMVCMQPTPFMDKIQELLDLYEDDESLKILWMHFKMLFHPENVPAELDVLSMEGLCVRPQYFLEGGRFLEKQRIMVDCGAYVGDTLEDLIYKTKFDNFEQYDCYEVFPPTYKELNCTVEKLPDQVKSRVHTYSVGVGENDTTISASSTELNSCILRNGDTEVRTVRLDDVYADKNVTFIKMDIEGSEQAALRGGKDMISRCRPMCAICIYHSFTAFWEVPKLLKEYVPEYKLILRHHTTYWDDSVCYAKVGEWK